MSLYWPIILIVVSNIIYNIYNVCSKSTPNALDPLAALTVTYVIGAIVSACTFFILNPGGSLAQQYKHLNWSTFVLGLAVVGLETGSIYMYKAGWNISTGQLVYSSILALCLIPIGYFFYHETITVTKIIGVLVCLAGLFLINK